MRQIVLDTETTGLDPKQGHKIIEIGCVELLNRRLSGETFHVYIKPEREIDEAAIEVHGISNESLLDKPIFAEVVDDFLAFVKGAELIIHNAPFDVGFLDAELQALETNTSCVNDVCTVLDTLKMARAKHPGQKNSLDALCRRYHIDNSHRDLHGALLDAEILAEVYLAMTGGQVSLSLTNNTSGFAYAGEAKSEVEEKIKRFSKGRKALRVIKANPLELDQHGDQLNILNKTSETGCYWIDLEE